MIAKLAYLTTPAPGRFILNFQNEGCLDVTQIEISKAHLANIIIDGTSIALREAFVHHRVPAIQTESVDERADSRRQQPA